MMNLRTMILAILAAEAGAAPVLSRGSWTAYPSYNTYDGAGSYELDSDTTAIKYETAQDCKDRCEADFSCQCVTFQPATAAAPSKCWKRTSCVPDKFAQQEGYTVFMKDGFSPSTSTCALGPNVRVVTDMGFDDMGAFSVLNAAGCTPQKALTVQGMMPSSHTGDFSRFLTSWLGDLTEVHQGPPDGTCYTAPGGLKEPCQPDLSWLADFRTKMHGKIVNMTRLPWDETEENFIPYNEQNDDFWKCEEDESYTLLVISPESAVATRLLGDKGSDTLKCIKEIVFMGGLFGNEQLEQTDPQTIENANGPVHDPNDGPYDDNHNPADLTETNVVSDESAARALWVDKLKAVNKVPLRIFSLETASCDRDGLQSILFSGQTGIYKDTDQGKAEKQGIKKLLEKVSTHDENWCEHPPNMLGQMVCSHDECNFATLDFDIVAATYIWRGDEQKDPHTKIHFEQISPMVDLSTAVTTYEASTDSNVWLATTFDAPAWFELLEGKLSDF